MDYLMNSWVNTVKMLVIIPHQIFILTEIRATFQSIAEDKMSMNGSIINSERILFLLLLLLLSRVLFDRVVHLSVSVKKVKFFFKRYLDYEKKHGTPESIQAVKQKAMEYVESKGSDAAN